MNDTVKPKRGLRFKAELIMGRVPYVPQKLRELSERVKNELGPHRETVRTLLSWFTAKRHGRMINEMIRTALKEVGLEAPGFDTQCLDCEISFTAVAPDICSDSTMPRNGNLRKLGKMYRKLKVWVIKVIRNLLKVSLP